MENFLEELNLQREATKRNIEKAFGNDIEKARSGVYADTAENRKLQRVGQHYGGRKQEQPTDGQPRAKKQEEQTKSGSKQKPDAGSKADIYSKMSQDEKIQVGSVLGKMMNVLGADKYKKEINPNKIKLTKTDDGNWKIEHNGNSISTISISSISDDTAKKIGWLKDDVGENTSDIPDSYGRVKKEDYERELNELKDEKDSWLASCLTDKDNYPYLRAAAETILLDRGKSNLVDRAKRLLKREQNIPNNSLKIVNAVKTAGEGNGGFITTKSGLSALKNLRKEAANFAKKNPDVEFDDEMASALVELPVDEFIDEYGDYNGLEEFGEALEKYYESLYEYTDSEDDEREMLKYEKELRVRKANAEKDVEGAIIADQGGIANDEETKNKLNNIKRAASDFMEKNPDLRISKYGWSKIVDGGNVNSYKMYDGFKELNDAIDEYMR